MLLWCPKNVFRLVGTIKCIIYLFKLKIYLYRCIYLFISNLSLFLSFSLAFFSPFLSVPAPTGFSGADRHLCWSLHAFLQTNCLHQPRCSPWEPCMNPPLLYCTLYPCARACAPACPPPTPGYSGTLTQVRVRPFCSTVKYSKPKIAYWSWTCVYAATVLYVLCDAAVVAILHGSLPSQIGIGICLT